MTDDRQTENAASEGTSERLCSMTDTDRLDLIEEIFRNETVSFSFMRFAGWEANKPWLCDRHNFGYKRWNAFTLRELIDGLAAEYRKSSNGGGDAHGNR